MPTFFAGQTDYIEKLNDVDAAAGAAQNDIDAHIADTTAAHAATAISNTPAGNIAATTVQAAINELDSEKLSASATALPSSFASASINSVTPTGGTLAVTGSISATTNLTLGNGTGIPLAAINGAASGTNGGASLVVQTAGNSLIGLGNKSALLGGAYDATPMLYGNAPIEVNQAISVTGTVSATGNIRLANAFSLMGRNAANTLDLTLIRRTAADLVNIDPDGYGSVFGGNLLVGQNTNSNGARLAVTASGSLPAAIFNTGTNQNIWLRPASQTLGSLSGPALSGINDAASASTDLTLQGANVNVVIENTLRGQWSSTGLSVTGSISATARIDYPSYTVATLPAVGSAGGNIYVSDESGGAQPAFSDGTNWRRYTDRAIVT